MKIKIGSYRNAGELLSLLGLSVRDPFNEDSQDRRILDSPLAQEFLDLPKGSIRHTAGSQSDNISDTNDPEMQYALTTLLPALPESVTHDFTWPPQLPVEDLTDWVTQRTGRITIFNEPPNRIPSIYANGQVAVDQQKIVYSAHPNLQSKMWIQTGKPEIVRYPELSDPSAMAKNQSCLDAASSAVIAGELPARIVTTHKIYDAYPADKLAFYRQLMEDYKTYFGDNVEVCFQEFNYAESESNSVAHALACGEFLLILARLKGEGYNISGAAYHQGFAVGTSNIFGLDGPSGTGNWGTGFMYLMWDMFGKKLRDGKLNVTTVTNQPDRTQVIIVSSGWRRFALYSNVGAAQSVNLDGVTFEYVNSSGSQSAVWSGTLPANSVGVVRLRRRLVK